MVSETCKHRKENGEPCSAAPLRDEDFCLWHHPDHADVVAEGRRLGGSRRKKEATVTTAFDFEGTGTVEQIGRLVDIAIIETLTLENSNSRNRTLASLALTAMKVALAGKYAHQLGEVRSTLGARLVAMKRR